MHALEARSRKEVPSLQAQREREAAADIRTTPAADANLEVHREEHESGKSDWDYEEKRHQQQRDRETLIVKPKTGQDARRCTSGQRANWPKR